MKPMILLNKFINIIIQSKFVSINWILSGGAFEFLTEFSIKLVANN